MPASSEAGISVLEHSTSKAWEARRGSNQTRSGLCYTSSMVVRNISQAKAELSALIVEVQKGNEVILAKAGKPVARLVAYRGPRRPRTPGCMAGDITVAADFDVLPEDMAEAFGIPKRDR
jgi:prevent-host-death family protein